RAHRRILAAPWGQAQAEDQERVRVLLDAGVRPAMPRVVNSLGMAFVLVPPGVFWMGERKELRCFDDEVPLHEVAITRGFWLGTCPVTQAQYQKVTRRQRSAFRAGGSWRTQVAGLDTSDFPVENVSWLEAVDFCARLGARSREARAGYSYRLPSEA